MPVPLRKQLIVFDLDETLSLSKTPIDKEMAGLLKKLLARYKVSVISGGLWEQMRTQLVAPLLECDTPLENLFIFPTCGACFYTHHDGGWVCVYENMFTQEEKKKIFDAFDKALPEAHFAYPKKLYGELIEDRGTQVTFSAFGQRAPLAIKSKWDPDMAKRKHIIEKLVKYIPEFEIRAGGSTSIDVTIQGIDKAYGVRQMETHLKIPRHAILFIGDRLHPGGNDYPVKELGVQCRSVRGPEDTKMLVRSFL